MMPSQTHEMNEETIRIPIKWTVTGCPMVIDQNTLGMSVAKEQPNEQDDDEGMNMPLSLHIILLIDPMIYPIKTHHINTHHQ